MKTLKKTAAVAMAMVMVLSMSFSVKMPTQAAKRLNYSKITLGVGISTGKTFYNGSGEKVKYKNLSIKNKSKKATYTFKSTNSKVAKVSKSGKVTGVSKGTAKIVATQRKNGKTTTIGKCTVVVKAPGVRNAYFDGDDEDDDDGDYEDDDDNDDDEDDDLYYGSVVAKECVLTYVEDASDYEFEVVDGEDVVEVSDEGFVLLDNGVATIKITNAETEKVVGEVTITVENLDEEDDQDGDDDDDDDDDDDYDDDEDDEDDE
ncbi:MAG: Ig-like domain-containing protein [Lachnospiraceae bacterium]|nr:Ig-like domain-containing protein [Lachnospiraceae bacterium]